MQKKKLCQIPLKPRKAVRNTATYTIETELAEVGNECVLIANLYYKHNSEPNLRIFLTKTDYITERLETPERKWAVGKISNYIGDYSTWFSNEMKSKIWFSDTNSWEMIKEFTGIDKEYCADIILQYQNKICEKRLERKRKRYTDPIDEKMKEVRETTESFKKWIEEDVLYYSKYIYYQYSRKKEMQGYCTHCKSDVVVTDARHNERGHCPLCGSEITYKAISKAKNVVDKEKAALIQKTKSGFITRYFDVGKTYCSNYKNPELSVWETKRVFYTNDLRADSYVYSNFRNVCIRWIHECDEITGGYSSDYGYSTWRGQRTIAALYPKNLKQILKDTDLRNAELHILANIKKNFSIDIEGFIDKIRKKDFCCEKLIKCELINLARDYANRYNHTGINKKGKTLNKILGVKNDDAKVLIESNAGSRELRLFKAVRKNGKRISSEQLKALSVLDYSTEVLASIIKYTSVDKVIKYMQIQRCADKFTIYRDYLDMCKELNMDLKNTFVLFPNHLRVAHDMNVELINEKKNRKTYAEHNSKYAAIKEKYAGLNEMFEYEDDEFLIRPPLDAAEIVKEGQKLHHCVGGGNYSSRMAKGEIAILFLREKKHPAIPYYTIEVNMKTFQPLQYHGYKNHDKDKKAINKFINKWKKEILLVLSKKNSRKAG